MENSPHGLYEDRARILRMVEAGDLSASDAVALLDRMGSYASGAGTQSPPPVEPVNDYAQPETPPASPPSNGAPQWLRVRVTDLASGRSKVAVSIPFKLASWGLRAGAHFSPTVEGIDLAELSRLMDEGGAQGLLVDVVDDEDGEHVQVFVE